MPAPMITIRWRAGSCLDSEVAIAVIYQMQVSAVNAITRSPPASSTALGPSVVGTPAAPSTALGPTLVPTQQLRDPPRV
jgi:hypothetical protein